MTFKFDNYARPVERQAESSRTLYPWFRWTVFMDEPAERLAEVDRVEYRLHETFPNPIRVVSDPDSRFALHTSGWGEFVIFITVYLKNGSEEHTKYQLDLSRSWPSEMDAATDSVSTGD
jgi:transcription initiation factor IIF auxiliary subunit